jgi:hypothetical protein
MGPAGSGFSLPFTGSGPYQGHGFLVQNQLSGDGNSAIVAYGPGFTPNNAEGGTATLGLSGGSSGNGGTGGVFTGGDGSNPGFNGGTGIMVTGGTPGTGSTLLGGDGAVIQGGSAGTGESAGRGLYVTGGSASNAGSFPGIGILVYGGDNKGNSSAAADGIVAYGGYGGPNFGGEGAYIKGGGSSGVLPGVGLLVYGGVGNGVTGDAAEFHGNVNVFGTLAKSAGSFKIDHPLDPANKFLSHSFVESPDMKNIYDGIVTLDADGTAWVAMPDWFEALNQDFRYQLTSIGAPGPNLYIASTMQGNQFRIAGGAAGASVSWQVTGTRHDAYANAHRIPVEEDKKDGEKGFYTTPELFQQGPEKQIGNRHVPATKAR